MKGYLFSETTGKYYAREALVWGVGFKENPNKEVAPAGKPFDVSVPAPFRWLFDPHNPKYFPAARLHDHLLEIGYDRVSAAGAFNHGLKSTGVNWATRVVMTTAVVLFKFK